MSKTRMYSYAAFGILFFTTAFLSLALGNFGDTNIAAKFRSLHNVIYGWHLITWMILGMTANYLWDLHESQKSFKNISFSSMVKPVLVGPIVFFTIWSLVVKDEHGLAKISMEWPIIAFQNGFFWQVIFNKQQTNIDPPPDNQ